MTARNRFHLSPALVISCVALFVALAGSAVAAGLVAKNSVRSPQIVDGAVRTVDLHDQAVTTSKVAENAIESPQINEDGVTAADLGAASLGSSEVQDQSLTDQDLGPNSVGSSELQAGSIRAGELGPLLQVTNATAVAANGNTYVTANCPAGTTVISGGGEPSSYQVYLVGSIRSGNGWMAVVHSTAGASTTLTAYAYCLVGGSSN